jgi:hypothetical protein
MSTSLRRSTTTASSRRARRLPTCSTITAPRTVDPAVWFRLTPPSDTVYVVLRRFHWGDAESVIIWLGQIISVSDNADESATLRCQAISITLRRGGLRMSWQRGCIHALYDQNCTVDKSLYAYPRTIASVAADHFNHFGGFAGRAVLAGRHHRVGALPWHV